MKEFVVQLSLLFSYHDKLLPLFYLVTRAIHFFFLTIFHFVSSTRERPCNLLELCLVYVNIIYTRMLTTQEITQIICWLGLLKQKEIWIGD